ncbi:transposase, partial [Streptomyces sp. NPDC007095]|uniref:transposase n=1 Tax=Streptomyces sp. NPDC007095 TaxID=3154482 RepID=UPI0033DEC2BE
MDACPRQRTSTPAVTPGEELRAPLKQRHCDNGIKWRAMPADFPPWDRVYAFFRRWRDHAL